MTTISEKLLTLNNTKQAIKVAIENKGQDMSGVPFTDYANKIENIEIDKGKRFTGGTVTFASLLPSQTVTHNLGVKPTIFLMYAKINKEDVNYGVEGQAGNQGWNYGYRYFNCKPYYPLLDFNFSNASDGGTISQTLTASTYATKQSFSFSNAPILINVTDTTIKTGYGASYIYYPINVEFEWIAIE